MKSAGRTVCKKCNEIFQPILNKLLKENKELTKERNDFQNQAGARKRENKELRKRLDDWIYQLAYYTEDEVATPQGVKKFIGNLLKLLEQYKFDIKVERSLKAQPNALKASEVKELQKVCHIYVKDTVANILKLEDYFYPKVVENKDKTIYVFEKLGEENDSQPKPLSKGRIGLAINKWLHRHQQQHLEYEDLMNEIYDAQAKEKPKPLSKQKECRCPKCGDMHTKEIEVAQSEEN